MPETLGGHPEQTPPTTGILEQSVGGFRQLYEQMLTSPADGIDAAGNPIAIDCLTYENPHPNVVEETVATALTSGFAIAAFLPFSDAKNNDKNFPC